MKVLVLAPYVPHPAHSGGRRRLAALVEAYAGFARVRVLAVGDPSAAEVTVSRRRLDALGVRLDVFPPTGPLPGDGAPEDVSRDPEALAHFRAPALAAALAETLAGDGWDLLHVEELVMAPYAVDVSTPRLLSRQKVESAHLVALAEAGLGDAAALRREATRFARLEARLAGRFGAVAVVGESDRLLLEGAHGAARVHVLPLTVDAALRCPPERTREVRHVLLYGAQDYAPNAEAHLRFCRDAWPELARRAPPLGVRLVGSGALPGGLPEDARIDRVGYVEAIERELTGPGVLVVPLRVGGGARTKVLEALACGMPVVSTAIGVENLGLEAGRHYLPAESAADTVDAVLRLCAEPETVAALGRAGSARVEEAFRGAALRARLEPLARALSAAQADSPGRPAPAPAGAAGLAARPGPALALLLGVAPLPEDAAARGLGFPGHRTAQFRAALEAAGLEVQAVLLDEEPGGAPPSAPATLRLAPERFRGLEEIQRRHDRLRPTLVVAAGGYHAARVASLLATEAPRWIDLPGDLAAEAQARAAVEGDLVLADAVAVLRRALAVGDRFSVVGRSQRLALLGQLGLAGRLVGERLGQEPVAVVPVACDGPASPPPLPRDGFEVLWSGGFNAWMDVATLVAGLEQAMAAHDGLRFVASGGPVREHAADSQRRFWERVRGSRFAARFEDRGRLPRAEQQALVARSHVAIALSLPCLEAELGSRQRVVEALAHGRPVVLTALGELAAAVDAAGAGRVVAPGDAAAVCRALLELARERAGLEAAGAAARRLWEASARPAAATAPLAAWARAPERWPRARFGLDGASSEQERLRLQAQLDAIRGSYTFRALRWPDRLLGRAPRASS